MSVPAVIFWKKKLKNNLGIIRIDAEVDFEPGQFFNIVFESDGEMKGRPYSAASSPKQDYVEFYVKAMEEGRVAKHLLAMEEGNNVELKGPHGRFVLQNSNDVYMICAGSGVAPLMSMMRHLKITNDSRKVLFLNGASYIEDLGYLDELKDLDAAMKNFTYVPTLSREDDSWNGETGRVEEKLNLVIDTDRDVYVCGPPPMVVNVTKLLLDKGFSIEQIHSERYY